LESDPYAGQIIIFVVLLALSGFFSGSETETAFFSINKLLSQKLSNEDSASARRVLSLLKHPRRLLITILIGNTLVNVSAASVAALLVITIAHNIGLSRDLAILINVAVVSFVILVLSEVTPKVIAVKRPEQFAKSVSLIFIFFSFLFFPLSYVLDKFMALMTVSFGFNEQEKERLLEVEEFQTLLDIGEEQGDLEEEEKEMLHSIFEFGDTSVREIMIPRTDVVCVSHKVAVDDLINIIKSKGHTRIPVYRETIDQIQGIINAKDLLPLISERGKEFNALELCRPPIYVPESKKIDDLLRLFQEERQHLAIVVDEYGGTSGIVTLEDVIEEIVGEIRDEYDKESPLYRKVDEGTYIVNAKIDIESLDELVNINIPDTDEYETLGGFILEQTGALPNEKETILYNDFLLTMEKVEKNRIVQVRITSSPESENSNDKAEN